MNILLTTLMLSNMKNSENIQKKTKKCESRTQIPQFIFNGVAEQVRAQGTRGGAEMLGTVDLGRKLFVTAGRMSFAQDVLAMWAVAVSTQ